MRQSASSPIENIIFHFSWKADSDGVFRCHNMYFAGTTKFGMSIVTELLWPDDYRDLIQLESADRIPDKALMCTRANIVNNMLRNKCYGSAASLMETESLLALVPSWLTDEEKANAKASLKQHM